MLSQIRLLVFDLDYLIYDCAAIKIRALRDALIEVADDLPHDVRIPDELDAEEGFLDRGYRWTESLDIGLGEDALDLFRSAYRKHEVRLASSGAGRLFAGVPDILSFCHANEITTAIGAEASRDYLMAVSDRHDLNNLFEMVYCTEEYGMGGPDEMIEEVMARTEVNPSETLALGTRREFFSAARNIDVLSIGCGWGLHKHESLEESDLQALALAQVYAAIQEADRMAAQRAG